MTTVPELRLRPNAVVRIAGMPLTALARLHVAGAVQIAAELAAVQPQLEAAKERLCDRLHAVVSVAPPGRRKHALIELRRDVFNLRLTAPRVAAALAAELPPEVAPELDAFARLLQRQGELTAAGRDAYRRELAHARDELRALATADGLSMGLLLSSHSLLTHGVRPYVETPERVSAKHAAGTERSLAKYLSRIGAKTSPFSTFTHVALGRIAPRPGGDCVAVRSRTAAPTSRGHIRLNNRVFLHLAALLIRHPEVRPAVAIRCNPTLRRDAGAIALLTNFSNVESFRRIGGNPLLEILLAQVASHPGDLTFGQLIEAVVAADVIDATAAELAGFVDQLIEIGVLELHLGVAGTDPAWDRQLQQRLAPLAERPAVRDVVTVLERLRARADRYPTVGVREREAILVDAHQDLSALCGRLRAAIIAHHGLADDAAPASPSVDGEDGAGAVSSAPPAGSDPRAIPARLPLASSALFYEDSVLDVDVELDAGRLTPIAAALHDLLRALTRFDGLGAERQALETYFAIKYGDRSSVPLLTFYEDYYRDYKKARAADTASPGVVAAPFDAVDARLEAARGVAGGWQQRLAAGLRGTATPERVDVRLADLQAAHGDAAPPPGATMTSFGAMLQIVEDDAGAIAVVNGTSIGYGKMLGRFLHLFDPGALADIRARNQALAGDDLLVEDCDASCHNANVHPPLVGLEIWMPGSENSQPEQAQVSVAELHVQRNAAGELELIHQPSGKRAAVLDLGFQAWEGRSRLYTLLAHFSPSRYIGLGIVCRAANAAAHAEGIPAAAAVWRRPRVVVEDVLVVQRQAWIVATGRFPIRTKGEDDWDFLVRVTAWRREHGIPDQVFVTIGTRADVAGAPAGSKLGRDDYKPQYVSFLDPFLVSVLERLVERAPAEVVMEEMLPAPEHLAAVGGERRVTELVVEWDGAS